jgi:NDP-sugar pyrophosphorylase family protein
MIGVIVLSGPFEGMHGLDAERSPSLLPLGDRPALQHIVESLVTQGITNIELIVGHGPERVEALLGTGDRWGCTFRYHLATQPDHPYRSLKIISGLKTEPWVLIHAEQYPCVEFSAPTLDKPVLYYGTFEKPPQQLDSATPESTWGGTVVMPPSEVSEEFSNYTFDELQSYFEHLLAQDTATVVNTTNWLDVSTPAGLLHSQARLLKKELPGLLISGTERQPGVWISRNVTIHPSATMVPPVCIGSNTRLSKGVRVGPYAVVGADCIVDSNTIIDYALIFEGSYVGESLEVHQAIVAQNLLVNVRLDASVDVAENFLLSRLERPRPSSWARTIVQSAVALLLILIFLPFSLLSILYYFIVHRLAYTSQRAIHIPAESGELRAYSLLCIGVDAWSLHRPAGWSSFLRQFLPGLFAVARGRLHLVGLPPRTASETASLQPDWRAIHLCGKAGLITEASTTPIDPGDEMQLYLADAYYSIRQSPSHDLLLIARYFMRLVVPMSGAKS